MTKSEKALPFTSAFLIKSALELLAFKGWAHFSLQDLAAHLGCPLSAIYAFYMSKTDLLEAIIHHIEQETLKVFEANTLDIEDMSEPERLFEAIMAGFEAILPYKSALKRLTQDFKAHPTLFLEHVPLALHSLKWLLEMANIRLSGLLAPLQVRAFAVLYLKLLSTWLEDHSEDLTKTMAAVDRMTTRYLPYIFHPERLLDCKNF